MLNGCRAKQDCIKLLAEKRVIQYIQVTACLGASIALQNITNNLFFRPAWKKNNRQQKTEHIFGLEGLKTAFFQAEFVALPESWLWLPTDDSTDRRKQRKPLMSPPATRGSRRSKQEMFTTVWVCVCNMSGQTESLWVDGNIILKGPVGSQKTQISSAMIKLFNYKERNRYLIWVFIVMCFSCLCTVTFNIIDSFYFICLHVFPHNRVSVHEEPGENIKIHVGTMSVCGRRVYSKVV